MPKQQMLTWGLIALGWLGGLTHGVGWANEINADWQLAKQDRGVAVYTGAVAGSKFLAFKAVTIVADPLDEVLAVLLDHTKYPLWYANCEQAQVLDVLGTDQTMVRIVVKTPFPLASRETINTVTLTRSEHSARIDLVNAPGAVPLTRGVVRMQTAGGTWVLQTVPRGTQVLQTYHADPQVKMPAWMINRFIIDGPLQSMKNLADRLERETK